jgi:hypothetical protein
MRDYGTPRCRFARAISEIGLKEAKRIINAADYWWFRDLMATDIDGVFTPVDYDYFKPREEKKHAKT